MLFLLFSQIWKKNMLTLMLERILFQCLDLDCVCFQMSTSNIAKLTRSGQIMGFQGLHRAHREDCDLVLGVCPAWPPHHWLHFNLYSVLTSGDGQMINSRIIVLDTYWGWLYFVGMLQYKSNLTYSWKWTEVGATKRILAIPWIIFTRESKKNNIVAEGKELVP